MSAIHDQIALDQHRAGAGSVTTIRISEERFKRTLVLTLANVEDHYLGLSLTEHGEGFNLRRVAMEIHELEKLRVVRDFLDRQIEIMGKGAEDDGSDT